MRTLVSQLTAQELGDVVENCRYLWYYARFKSGAWNHFRIVRNVFGRLRKSSENFGYVRVVFGNPDTQDPVKNLTPLTQKKLAGISVIGKVNKMMTVP